MTGVSGELRVVTHGIARCIPMGNGGHRRGVRARQNDGALPVLLAFDFVGADFHVRTTGSGHSGDPRRLVGTATEPCPCTLTTNRSPQVQTTPEAPYIRRVHLDMSFSPVLTLLAIVRVVTGAVPLPNTNDGVAGISIGSGAVLSPLSDRFV